MSFRQGCLYKLNHLGELNKWGCFNFQRHLICDEVALLNRRDLFI
jgi:hypothetical protein